MPQTITTLRLGLPGIGLVGRISNTPGPPQLLTLADLKSGLGLVDQQTPVNYSTRAATADKWTTPISITFTPGDVTGSVSFDGSTNVSLALTMVNTGVTAGSYVNANITVDAKGRVTAASSGSAAAYGPLMNGDTAPSGVVVDPDGRAVLVEL